MPSPYVFLYLPKTGMSPVLAHLASHLEWNEGIVYLGPWGDRQRHLQGRPAPDSWSRAKMKQVAVLAGNDLDLDAHRITGADKGRYVTVLRDPAERIVGDFNAKADRGEDLPDFWEWYDERRVNQQTRFFCDLFDVESVSEVAENLKSLWFVTTTEHLPEDAPRLFEAIGVPAEWDGGAGEESDLEDAEDGDDGEAPAFVPSERRLAISDEIRSRIHEDHPRDVRLYELALKRRESKRKRYGWS